MQKMISRKTAKCFVFLLAFAAFSSAQAAGIECPEETRNKVEISPAQAKVFMEGSEADLGNEITSLIVSLRKTHPGIDYSSQLNAAMAAYCPVIANSSLPTQEKSTRIWRFEAVMRERLASLLSSGGVSSIMAQVDLSPNVYAQLRDKAASLGMTPSQYMAQILDKATERPGQ